MRINKFVAQATGLSRRAADEAVSQGRVSVNGVMANIGNTAEPGDTVTLDHRRISIREVVTIMLNKPAGYVCSRNGQGSKTVYELLPPSLHELKPVGRLDKDSSGLLLLTNDGQLANQLTHPRYHKEKIYEVTLDKPLLPEDKNHAQTGVQLEDGASKLQISDLRSNSFTVTMHEGRNRQIRRSFAALGYQVKKLHRTQFGPYKLSKLTSGQYRTIPDN